MQPINILLHLIITYLIIFNYGVFKNIVRYFSLYSLINNIYLFDVFFIKKWHKTYNYMIVNILLIQNFIQIKKYIIDLNVFYNWCYFYKQKFFINNVKIKNIYIQKNLIKIFLFIKKL